MSRSLRCNSVKKSGDRIQKSSGQNAGQTEVFLQLANFLTALGVISSPSWMDRAAVLAIDWVCLSSLGHCVALSPDDVVIHDSIA